MFGFEFTNKEIKHQFPQFATQQCIPPSAIQRLSPLVWQEHCVECAMPACYGTCKHYLPRADGRCLLFRNGIERVKDDTAILGQHAIIDMREWAKLETFFFPSSFSYEQMVRLNNFVVQLATFAQTLRWGWARRFMYYIKEYVTRKIGYGAKRIPHYFLFECYGLEKQPALMLENRAGNRIVSRQRLAIKPGYNRFLFPTEAFSFQEGVKNNLLLYPEESAATKLFIISLELVDFEADYYAEHIAPKPADKVKLVVWDLDNTLWDGTLVEDGLEGIQIKPEMLAMVKENDVKGILNSIASKNDEQPVLEALQHLGIEDYFLAIQCSWGPKSASIKHIAKELNIGADTFVFVDDTGNERQEVKANLPEVRVCAPEDLPALMQEPCFDVPVTADSKHRRQSYREISVRNRAAMAYEDDFYGFLRACHMRMDLAHPAAGEQERCYELLQRTNQLNISGERISREELTRYLTSSDYDCYRIKVADKYGDYGLVGFAIFQLDKKQKLVDLKHFVFSCRAARKELEPSFFAYMMGKYQQQGYAEMYLECKKTKKNKLMQDVIFQSGYFEKLEETDSAYRLHADLSTQRKSMSVVTITE